MIDYYDSRTKTLTAPNVFLGKELINIPDETLILKFYRIGIFKKNINDLPQNLTEIFFDWGFNQCVDYLPQKLTQIRFGILFNQKVNVLPQSLTHIIFNRDFNQKVDNLPKNLTYLFFGNNFNQKVNNLPKNLFCLIFGNSFNQKINNLPKSLFHIDFGYKFTQNIYRIPKSINELSLYNNNEYINNIPNHIIKIYIKYSNSNIDKKIENLPPSIKEIIIQHEIFKKYIKIPFGCILTIKKLNN
jgi:hypothetical protein